MKGEKSIITLKSSNKYLNASLIYILANAIGQGTTMLANSFFTRYMSQADYGSYSNYYSFVSLLVPFAGMNLYIALTNAYIDYKSTIYKYRSSTLLLSLFGLVITGIIMALIKAFVGLSLPWICVLLTVLHAYGFFLVNYYIYSMNMENNYIAKGLMLSIPNVLQVLFAVIALVICNTYISRAIGGSFAILSCGLFATFLILKKSPPVINKEYWSYALKISLPAIIGSVSGLLMQQCDKVMITSICGAEVNAVYSLVYYTGYILYAVQQATSGGWQVWLYNTLSKKKNDSIPVVQKWYMFAMLVMATGLYMIAPEFVKILSPSNYWHFEYIVPFIIGSYFMIMYSVLMSVAEYNKKTGVVSFIVSMAAVLNVTLNYLLIPIFGGVGAAYTSVASYVFIFVVSVIYLKMVNQYFFNSIVFLSNTAVVIMLGIVFYFVRNLIVLRYIFFLAILLVEGIYFFLKLDEIKILFGGRILADK